MMRIGWVTNQERINIDELTFRSDVRTELFLLEDRLNQLKIDLAKMEEMVKDNKKDITGVANALRTKIEKTEDELKDDIIERTKSSNSRMYEWIKWAGMALIGGLVGHYGVKK